LAAHPNRVVAVGFSPPPARLCSLCCGVAPARLEEGEYVSSQARLLCAFSAWCVVRGRQPAVRGVRCGSMLNNELSTSCAVTSKRASAQNHLFSLSRPCPPKPRTHQHEHVDRVSARVWEVQQQFDKAAFSTSLGSRMPRRRPSSFPYGRRLSVADRPRRRLATTRCGKCSAVSGRRRVELYRHAQQTAWQAKRPRR